MTSSWGVCIFPRKLCSSVLSGLIWDLYLRQHFYEFTGEHARVNCTSRFMGYAVHLYSTILPVAAPALCINAHMQDVFMRLEQVSLPNEADLLYCLVRFTQGIERAVRNSISTLIHFWNSASNVQVGDQLYMIIELRFFHFMCVCVCICVQIIPVSVSLLVNWSTTHNVTQKTPNLTSKEPVYKGILHNFQVH